MNRSQRLLGLSELPQLSVVDSLVDSQRPSVHVKAPPPKCEQFAWSKGFGHVQREQNAIPEGNRCQHQPELVPAQYSLVHRSQLLRQNQFSSWSLLRELLLDGFLENRFHVEPGVLEPPFRQFLRQIVQVPLQHDFVDLRQRQIAKSSENILLDLDLANPRRVLFPCAAFTQWEKAVAGEPAERDDLAVVLGLSCACRVLVDLCLQRFSCLIFAHLRAKAEIDADALPFSLYRGSSPSGCRIRRMNLLLVVLCLSDAISP